MCSGIEERDSDVKSMVLSREVGRVAETLGAEVAAVLAASVVEGVVFVAIVAAGMGVVDAKRMLAPLRIKVLVCENRRALCAAPGRDARFLESSPWAWCCTGIEENCMVSHW